MTHRPFVFLIFCLSLCSWSVSAVGTASRCAIRLAGLDDDRRGWAVLEIGHLIEPAEVQRLYDGMPNVTQIAFGRCLQDLETGECAPGAIEHVLYVENDLSGRRAGVNVPLNPMSRRIITEITKNLNAWLPENERGKLIVETAQLRRSDGSSPISPITIHRDRPYLVVNVTLLGEGSVVYQQGRESLDQGIKTSAGSAVIFAGISRASRGNGGDAWKAGPHSAPESRAPRLTLSWTIHRLR